MWRKIIFIILIIPCVASGTSLDHGARWWTQLTFHGDIPRTDNFQYALELHARFNDSNNVYDSNVFRLGAAYKINPRIKLWLGYDVIPTLDPNDDQFDLEQRIWQQLRLHIWEAKHVTVHSRTRFEQRFDHRESGTALRGRQKFSFQFPNIRDWKIIPYIADEIFINFNKPDWVSARTLSQQRVYLGFVVPQNEHLNWRLEYINQLKLNEVQNKMNHVFRIVLDIKT